MKERKVNIEGVKVILEMERERDEADRREQAPTVAAAAALPPLPATTANSH
jgi:hypothetical protein